MSIYKDHLEKQKAEAAAAVEQDERKKSEDKRSNVLSTLPQGKNGSRRFFLSTSRG